MKRSGGRRASSWSKEIGVEERQPVIALQAALCRTSRLDELVSHRKGYQPGEAYVSTGLMKGFVEDGQGLLGGAPSGGGD